MNNDELGKINRLYEYAISYYQIFEENFRNLDNKANQLIVNISILIGILGLIGVNFTVRHLEKNAWLGFIEGCILFISFLSYSWGIWDALTCLEVKDRKTIPKPSDVKDWFLSNKEADSEERLLKLFFSKYDIAAEALHSINIEKARLVARSSLLAKVGLATSFLLTFLVIVVTVGRCVP